MTNSSILMAKLSGIRKAVAAALLEKMGRGIGSNPKHYYMAEDVGHYFVQAVKYVEDLKQLLPDFYGDFKEIYPKPLTPIGVATDNPSLAYSRSQLEYLVRDIDQIFEIRANSELQQPKQKAPKCVFITHGRSGDWRLVQPYLERDLKVPTIELAQEASAGQTVIEKLFANSEKCSAAVIVMTGDDHAADDTARVRENVMHEIGFFQGRYGRDRVVLLHEDGVSIPTNLSGIVYVPYPRGQVEAGFHVLAREINAIFPSG